MNTIGTIMSVDKYDGRSHQITYTLHGQKSMISLAAIADYNLYKLFGMTLDRLGLSVDFEVEDRSIHTNLYAYDKPCYKNSSVILRRTNGEVYDWSFYFTKNKAPAMNFYGKQYAISFAIQHMMPQAIDVADVYIVNKTVNINLLKAVEERLSKEIPPSIKYLQGVQFDICDKKGLAEVVNTMKG